jgi:hypothetical protein
MSIFKQRLFTQMHELQLEDGEIEEFLENEDLEICARKMFTLGLHMVLNDPQITLTFSDKIQYDTFAKSKHYCLDGFPKEGNKCAIVLDAPR